MPINFSQPEPFDPAITAGAAATEFAAKTFPTIAQLYENAARLRASGGGGGGGGGGGPVQSGGPVQVLGRDDYGALAQVEQQANRQQQAANLGAELQWDPVGRHITQQEDFRREQAATEQANQDRTLRLLNPQLFSGGQGAQVQPGPTPRPIQWTLADQKQLNGAGQALADLRDKEGMDINSETYRMLSAPLQDQYDELTAKQQAADQEKKKQAYKDAVSEQAHQRGLLDLDMRHAGENGYKQIPDLPTPIRAVDKHTGKIYTVNADEIKHVAEAQKQARDFNSKLQLEREKQSVKDPIIEQKLELGVIDRYNKLRETAEKRFDQEDDMERQIAEKKNKNNPNWHWEPWTMDGRERYINDLMKARGHPATLEEALNEHRAGRNPGSKTSQSGSGPAKSLGSPQSQAQDHVDRGESRETAPLIAPSPELAQRQTQRADNLAEKVKSMNLPTEHVAEVTAALQGLKELNASHGGNLTTAPPKFKELAQKYRETLLKYGPRAPTPEDIERKTGGFWFGGKQ